MNVLLNNMLMYMAPFWNYKYEKAELLALFMPAQNQVQYLEEKVMAQSPLWMYKMCYTLCHFPEKSLPVTQI